MNNETEALTSELLALAQTSPNDPSRSKTARLRAVLPAVEAALSAGATREQVLDRLRSHGLDMTVAVFNTTLRRLRAAPGKAGSSLTADGQPATPIAPKPITRAPARPALRDPLIPNLGNAREPDDMDELIKHGKRTNHENCSS